MGAEDDRRRDELLRRFEAVIGGAELDDLRQLTGDLSRLGTDPGPARSRRERRDLRRPPLSEVRVFRVRADLKRSRPRIWRRLELRSDMTLDVVHRVLQRSFAWMDYHLWRFSIGGDPFGRSGQAFLCPWDVEEGEDDDDGLLAASDVRLDEVIQEPGDILFYVYDYGDSWELTLRLEAVADANPDRPAAALTDGRRAAPPEDCGGLLDGDELADVLEDPARFDLQETDALLRSPYIALTATNVDRRVIQILDRLGHGPLDEELQRCAFTLLADTDPPEVDALTASLAAFRWFLDRAAESDIPLTAAGYLRPVDVTAAAKVVPAMHRWIGKANRESDCVPILLFREALQALGLLQKRNGVLRLTRAGRAAQQAPEALWNHLAGRLVPSGAGFDTDATLLVLTFAASSAGAELPVDVIAAALTGLGWRTGDGQPIVGSDLYAVRALELLRNVGGPGDPSARWRVSPVAAQLAHAALLRR
ncbi:MAG TPA: plasmid pRiA4b ORF-3 family protein [Solirubrobacteraceae bacterium]|nr:plasmid pRiA4b ORF-3 family protein [Solirubrobacteraceae bacterium]